MEIRLVNGETADVEPGDFINCNRWFGDVWAEVKSVFYSGEMYGATITFYWHRKNPPTGWTSDTDRYAEYYPAAIGSMRFYQYRKVSKGAPPADARIIHASTYYTDRDMFYWRST